MARTWFNMQGYQDIRPWLVQVQAMFSTIPSFGSQNLKSELLARFDSAHPAFSEQA